MLSFRANTVPPKKILAVEEDSYEILQLIEIININDMEKMSTHDHASDWQEHFRRFW